MAVIVLNIADFRRSFPAFDDQGIYDDDRVTAFFNAATSYISKEEYGCMTTESRTRAIYLMMAHLMDISTKAADGENPQLITSSTVDKVSVSIAQPPVKSQWQYWLSLTPYGMELWALLSACAAGGFYIGGLPERDAFRKVYGIY